MSAAKKSRCALPYKGLTVKRDRGKRRGQFTMSQERDDITRLITEARASGARQSKACDIIGMSRKTLQRWHQPDTLQAGRLDAKQEPANKLTAWERQRIIKVANEPE